MSSSRLEAQAVEIAGMDRPGLVAAIRGIDCGFPVDFTPEYLDKLDLDKLRHLYLALCLRAEARRQEEHAPSGR